MKLSKKFMHLMLVLTMMAFFMFGCGEAETTTDTNAEKKDVVVEAQETTAEVEEPQEEAVEAEITETVETTEEKSEDPGEVTYITDFVTINEYVDTLDPRQPAILIYNETEKYIINMQEGQHYQLKSTDQIVFNTSELIGCGWNPDLGNETVGFANVKFLKPNYSAWESDQEFFFSKRNEKDEKIILTCYLTPPVE